MTRLQVQQRQFSTQLQLSAKNGWLNGSKWQQHAAIIGNLQNQQEASTKLIENDWFQHIPGVSNLSS